MLTNATVKAARSRASAYKLWDNAGLHLVVAPHGARSWRWRSRRGGTERVITLGAWPEMSLEEARAARDARADRGGDAPRVQTFEQLARAWHAAQLERWSTVHAADVLASLERDVFPAIGAAIPADIDSHQVLELLRAVEARGARVTAKRLRQRIETIFAFDLDQEGNPAAKVRAKLAPARAVKPHPAIVDVAELRALWAAIGALPATPAVLAVRLQAFTAVRSATVLGARWNEIEDLAGAAPLWRVPAARMKLGRAKKADAANDHLVPLSPAAAELLRAARDMHRGDANMHSAYADMRIFGPLGERALDEVLARAGAAGRHCPHGWRASFSTILNEARPEEQGAIDRALGHAAKNVAGKVDKVEGAYNRALLLDRRRRLYDLWADILSE